MAKVSPENREEKDSDRETANRTDRPDAAKVRASRREKLKKGSKRRAAVEAGNPAYSKVKEVRVSSKVKVSRARANKGGRDRGSVAGFAVEPRYVEEFRPIRVATTVALEVRAPGSTASSMAWIRAACRGGGFRQWAERMRDVEELLEDAQLRAEAARIRDRVRGSREDYKRHSKAPDWTKLQDLVANPLIELRKRIADEVRRKESPDSLVPIDRDPVPPQFAEGVRRYYERLGSGQ